MNVRELIEHLSQFNQDATVITGDYYFEVRENVRKVDWKDNILLVEHNGKEFLWLDTYSSLTAEQIKKYYGKTLDQI